MCYQVILCTYIPTQMRVCIWMICKANCYLGKALHKKDNVMDSTKTSQRCYSAVILRLYRPVVSSKPYKEHFTWKPAANDHHKMRVHVSRDFKVYIKWLRQYNGIYNYLVKKTNCYHDTTKEIRNTRKASTRFKSVEIMPSGGCASRAFPEFCLTGMTAAIIWLFRHIYSDVWFQSCCWHWIPKSFVHKNAV